MRIIEIVAASAIAIGLSIVPCAAGTQFASAKTLPAPGTPMPPNSQILRAYTIQRGMPYSGVRVVQTVFTFPNGERDVKGYSAKEWRDSEGRTRKDFTWKLPTGITVMVCKIDDPVALVRYIWKVEKGHSTVVTETHYKMEGSVTEVWPDTPHHKIQAEPGTKIIILKPHHDLNANPNDQTLGPEYMNGVYAEGTRSVEVFPPGKDGNRTDHPIKRIDEIWNAPDLNMVIKMFYDNGFGATERSDLKNIDRSEPDPSVFLPPANLPKREAPESDPVWKQSIGSGE